MPIKPMAALLQAIKRGSIRGVQLIIGNKQYHEGTFQTEAGTTALIEACKFGDKRTGVKMATILLKNNARIESQDFMGRNALHWACCKAHKEMIDLFIKSSEMLDLNAKDFNGNSVMYHTVSSGECDFVHYICRLYAENGGGVDAKNSQGISAVDLALKLGHKSCAVIVNRATGLTRTLNTTGCKDANCRALSRLRHPDDGSYKLIKRSVLEDDSKTISTDYFKKSNKRPAIALRVGEHRKTRLLSFSSNDLTIKEHVKLPALHFGELSLVSMYGRQTSKTEPAQTHERKVDIMPRKHGIFSGDIFPSSGENRLPSTYKELLVDFNSIYSAENTASYRKGVSKPKEKTKIVTFSETADCGQDKEDDTKAEDKSGKYKLARKVSKMSDTKFSSTFISKGKERRKSRKSRDDEP